MKFTLHLGRMVTGILFIFSGLIKANDPLGLSYKMQEFFDVWGLQGLDFLTLAFSIAMIAFEIFAGVAVILGWHMKVFSWLLLVLILFFTFLTGFALFSGKIRECGCFGDCIPLQAGQSFAKDVFLTVVILFIFLFQKRIKPLFPLFYSRIILFFSLIFSFAFQWYVLLHLPVLDCLPYTPGSSILTKMKIPAGAIPDSTVISFVYKHQGKEVEFTAENFPEDFNDSLYTFIRRYDKLVRKGNAEPAIKDFSLSNRDGSNITDSVLKTPEYKLLLFLKDGFREGSWQAMVRLAAQESAKKGIPSFLVTNVPIDPLYAGENPVFANFMPLRCDVTAIKTAARANPTLYLLKTDTIVQKWSYADLEAALKTIRALP